MLLRPSAAFRVEFIQMKCTAAAAATVNGSTCDSAASPGAYTGCLAAPTSF